MKTPTTSLPLRLAASIAALLLVAACGKKETASVESPKPAAAPGTASAPVPAEAPANKTDIAPVAPLPAAPTGSASAIVAKKPAPQAAASIVFVRAGPLAKARRLADFLGTLRPGETSLKLTPTAGEVWTIRQPVDGIDLPDLPQLSRTPWLHLETPSGGVLVPFAAIRTMSLVPVSQEKEKARARLVLQDGTELTGVVSGQLGGVSEFGRLEAPWRVLKEIEVITRDRAAPAEALPLAGQGVALLEDGTRVEFTSWAPVAGDVISDVLLAEGGTGPELVSLAKTGSVEFAGSDPKVFFYQHAVSLVETGRTAPVRRNIALTCVLLQQANGCVVCLRPASLKSITRS